MRRYSPCAFGAATAVLAACAAALPEIDPVGDATAATEVADAIACHDEAEPVDAGPPASGVLTVAAAVRATLHHDPRLQESLAIARAGLAAATQARRWPNPVLDVMFRFPDGGGRTMIEAGLVGDVLAILQTPTRAAAADQRLRAACAQAVATAIDVVAEVQGSYARVQALDTEAPVLAARVRAAQQLAELGRTRFAAGDGTQLELAELDALRMQAEIDALERGRERAAEWLRLRRLLGAPSGGDVVTLQPWAPPPALAATEERLAAVALQRRPELVAARAEVEALGDDLALAGLSWLAGAQLGAAFRREDVTSIGPAAALPLPVFDAGEARQQHVRAELAAARHRATERGREIIEAVRLAVANATAAAARLARVRDELLPLQQRRRTLAEAAYRSGDGEIGAMLRAEQELRAAEGLLLLLQRDVWVARIELERTVGGPAALAAAEQQDHGVEERNP